MINGIYLRKDVQAQMKSSFEQGGILVLNDFLDLEGLNGIKSIWKSKGKQECLADLYSYEKLPDSKNFLKPEFLTLLANIIGKQPKKLKLEHRKFGHRDFTLIHDEVKQQNRFIVLYRSAKEWDPSWGGQAVFTRGDGKPFVFPVHNNSIIIMKCNSKMFEFVKYVNNLAGENKFLEIKITA